MTVATPAVTQVHENGLNGHVAHQHHHHHHHPHQPSVNLPRFHPIAMNPSQPVHPEHMPVPNHPHFRPFPPPPMHEPGPPPPGAHPSHIDHIEARLRQLEHEEAARMAARSQLLAIRKREDEEFRRMTENAEAEEEELRRQRKRLKRESMGLGFNATVDSPPLRPTPPRRLSETSAATTLAFFKQQSPPEPRPIPVQAPPHHPPPPPPPQHLHDASGTTIRRKQKYTIKNVEAWGERHGRPAAHDPSGRALWKRPSDGSLVYLTCPVAGCGKADFVTLHGFMCHLTKKHKDRSLGSQSRALEVCGIVYDPNAPLPPVAAVPRASTEESRLESPHPDGYPQELETSSVSDDEPRDRPVKTESADRSLPAPPAPAPTAPFPPPDEPIQAPRLNGSTKQTISSIIDREPEDEPRRERPASHPPVQPETAVLPSPEQKPVVREEVEEPKSADSEKENTAPKDQSETK